MAETLSSDCSGATGGVIGWRYGTTSGDRVPVSDNTIQDLLRGVGMSLTGTAAAPAPARALVNQLLPVGTVLVQTVPGAETNTFTTRVAIEGTFAGTSRIGGATSTTALAAGALNILGRTLRLTAWGTLGTRAAADEPTITIDVGLGTAVLATTVATKLTAVVSPKPWILRVNATVTTAGTSGVIVSGGVFGYGTATTNGALLYLPLSNTVPGTGLTPVNLTTALVPHVYVTCDGAHADNRIRCYGCFVELIG